MKNLLIIAFVFALNFFVGAQVKVSKLCNLNTALNEISGMIHVDGKFWALNDGDNPNKLYQFDTMTGNILDSTVFSNVSNEDWEALTADSKHVFIGDFGNNNGTRKNLKIYYFSINELGKKNVECDTLLFSYEDQYNFNSNIFSEFDCEAFCASNDSLYLFSKSKTSSKCRIYALPVQKGYYVAHKKDSVFLNSWVTGATLNKGKLSLCGYVYFGSFAVSLFPQIEFNDGKVVKPVASFMPDNIPGPQQIESILQIDSVTYLIASEQVNSSPAALYRVTFVKTGSIKKQPGIQFSIKPNPVFEEMEINADKFFIHSVEVYDTGGKLVIKKNYKPAIKNIKINIEDLPASKYKVVIRSGKNTAEQWILKL